MLRHLLAWLLRLGVFGPLILGIADSSFFFLPFGNDLLIVILVASNHPPLPFLVLSAAIGSTLGVLLLDAVFRKGGEEGLNRMNEAHTAGVFQTPHEKPGRHCDRDRLSRPAAVSLYPCHRER